MGDKHNTNLIRINGTLFMKEEKLDPNKAYYGHSQGVLPKEEKLRVPLRSLFGVQAFYDRKEMIYKGLIFFAPPSEDGDKPKENVSWVLAADDGKLIPFGNELILEGSLTLIYSNLNILKTGPVKRGQVIGTVKMLPGYTYGVKLRAYTMSTNEPKRTGDTIRLENYYYNLPFME